MLGLRLVMVAGLVLVGGACSDDDGDEPTPGSLDGGVDGATHDGGDGGAEAGRLGFFVTSAKSATADLGGLAAADARCQALAAAVGAGGRQWRAFLSVEHDASRDGAATSAFERIGRGPWYNAKGALVAQSASELIARSGDVEVFLDESGQRINGQWSGSPAPNEHDMLTGTLPDGGVALGKTCNDWSGDAGAGSAAVVGHSDGLGPNQNGAPPYNSWFSVHDNGSCTDTAPRGGAGRYYCFAAD
jgi:hypothetical protein